LGDGAKPRDLEDRTFQFAESVRAFVKQVPRTASNSEDVFLGLEIEIYLGFGNWDLELAADS
jgi:hypothetical protein